MAINVNELQRVILSQKGHFNPVSLAAVFPASTTRIAQEIRQLEAERKVNFDHKDGHRMFWVVAGINPQRQLLMPNGRQTVPAANLPKNNMMDLPPHKRMEYVRDCADMVITGVTPAVLITGVAGVGKTFLVKSQLRKHGKHEGHDYHFIQGHASPGGLYLFLYQHRDAVVVFDDCDAVLENEGSIPLLKCALDSYDERKVSWLSSRPPEGVETSFVFTGSIIFVSNKDASSIDEAVKSRTMVIDLQMTRPEICDYLASILPVIQPANLGLECKKAVLAHLKEICDSLKQFNLRTFIKACRIYMYATTNQKDWKKMLQVLD